MFGTQSLTPRAVLRTWLELVRAAEGIAQFVPGVSNQLAWREFQNKLRAFYFFEYADSVLSLPNAVREVDVVSRLARLEVADSIWAAEGFGRHYAASGGAGQSLVGSRLTDFGSAARRYFVPFHTGMGLALADSWLGSTRSTRSLTAAGLQKFLDLCRIHAHSGFVGALYETLGLACRTQYPEMVREIDELLVAIDPEIAAYFWHGVGRAIYFVPTGFFPAAGLIYRALQKAQDEPPHDLGRANAMAGVAWALTLVNLREPKIMEDFLKNYGTFLPDGEAFANGAQSALMIWHDCGAEDPFLRAFCEHRPDSTDAEPADFWARYVGQPSQKAEKDYKLIASVNKLGELFRHHSLSSWIDGLRASASNGYPQTARASFERGTG
jgi:hypothetical protein